VEIFRRFSGALNKLVAWVAMSLLTILVLAVLVAVFFRYVLGDSLPWSEEVARYLCVWVGFIGASVALNRRVHIGVEFFVDRLPPSLKHRVKLAVEFVILGLLLFITWFGIELVFFQIPQRSSALLISMAWPYASVPVGTALMAVQCLNLILEDWGR
jgi:TRAP-type C4-dicarboxylate transport system permease small subunit